MKKAFRSFAFLTIIIYIVLFVITSSPFDSIGNAVSISVALYTLYCTFLWRFNPFDKTPRIYGTYNTHQQSSYQNMKYEPTVVIRQTLFSIFIIEKHKSGTCTSITSCLLDRGEGIYWQLIYTYRADPVPRPPSKTPNDPHYGTCIVDIHLHDQKTRRVREMTGVYFTNRHEPTRGTMELTLESKKTSSFKASSESACEKSISPAPKK